MDMLANHNNPLISVITISFNCKNEIEATINSVINQTYTEIEYIIIDGGSTDGTVDIIKQYSNRIKYWISEPDNGIYDAMNKGIHLATGKWINFMNSGDTFYNNTVIEDLLNIADHDSDIIYGNTNLLLSIGEYIQKGKIINKDNYMPFGHQASFVKNELLKQYNFDTKFIICADKHFFYTMYNINAIFEYVDLNITNYEAENGISANNTIQLDYEIGMIEGKTNLLIWKLRHLLLILYCNIKDIAIKLLPKCFIIHLRRRKLTKLISN